MYPESPNDQAVIVCPEEMDKSLKIINEAALKVYGRKSVDIRKALKRIADDKAEKISHSLSEKGPMTFRELLNETGFTSSQLNHALEEMKKNDLLILKDSRYYLTEFCVILLGGLDYVKNKLSKIPEDKILDISE